ncbi:lytic transglycosylase domain-containing protein, partial [Klebsiella pneumoniae]|nr:lytic transglycosylase domain-containing protein [Klebsiella pneumoniae]
PTRPAEPERKTLADYGGYPSALDAVKQKNDAAVAAYLENAGDSAMAENVRNEWLKSLGARRQWTLFAQEYAKLEPAGRAQEVECYADSSRNDYTRAAELVKNTGKLPSGCTKLLEQAAASGLLDGNNAWRSVRGLLAGRQTT